ncbi:MAG TPA: 1-deoxy-D-xylulose-5-phosphate synthase [Verrucomicrobiae bacterium]
MRWTRIMYIERKAGGLTGEARIGRVRSNKTGRTLFYRDQVFRRIVGGGFKSNYYDEATGEDYWISGCKRRGGDQLYATNVPIEIDDDVRVEYWRDIRRMPERVDEKSA